MEIRGKEIAKPGGGRIDLVYCEPGFFESIWRLSAASYYRVDVYDGWGERTSRVHLPKEVMEVRFGGFEGKRFYFEGMWTNPLENGCKRHEARFTFELSGRLVEMK
jgi:hypothetical protein